MLHEGNHRVALWPKPAKAVLQFSLQFSAIFIAIACNRSAIGMQQGMQLGMQLVATVATSSCNCDCNTVATFNDPSKQGLASPRKLHRWVQHVLKPPCTSFRGLHGFLEDKQTAVAAPGCNLQSPDLQPGLQPDLQPALQRLLQACNSFAVLLATFLATFLQFCIYCLACFSRSATL
jgi:hypothetical protein